MYVSTACGTTVRRFAAVGRVCCWGGGGLGNGVNPILIPARPYAAPRISQTADGCCSRYFLHDLERVVRTPESGVTYRKRSHTWQHCIYLDMF
jgi:hypothetical protein